MSHSNGHDNTRQLLVNGVADAVGFVGGALLGFWLGQLLGLDIFAPGYGTGSLVGIALQLLDHLLDLDGGSLGPVGQLTHFGGDHGKAATRFAGTGGLDGGVEGQQVGLLRNAANGIHH